MNIITQLEQAGLTENEIKVYLHLLSGGLAAPPQIAAATKIARPNCYKILSVLKDRGLITEQIQGKRKAYLPNDPQALVIAMQKKAEALSELLPDLRSLLVSQKNKPSIRFFEGVEGVKLIFAEMITAKEVLGVASIKKLTAIFGYKYLDDLSEQMQERGVTLRDIVTKEVLAGSLTSTRMGRKHYEYRTLPEESGDIPVDILIWKDCVAFVSFNMPVFGTIIKNAEIAAMMRVIFELSWKQLSAR
jgi:HTH-type transcriptional regulator, sugar sensing transcriptional regulator